MRKFSAHRIYPVSGPPIPFGIIETTDEGVILDIRDTGGKPVEEAGLEFYSGIIVPGLVNTHCHLELSHLAGQIPQNTGISGFVSEVSRIRPSDPEKIRLEADQADRIMYAAGVSGAGDISNTGITLSVKQKSRIKYHTFIEMFGLNQEVAAARFDQAFRIATEFKTAGLSCSLSPHATYSVGTPLWNLLADQRLDIRRISIHHDESRQERELLEHRTGAMAENFRNAGFDLSALPQEAPDIFRLLGKYLPGSVWILVHNTLTDPRQYAGHTKPGVFWVLCPRSNRYIENRFPDFERFAASGLTICIGTDSLASNLSLSVLEEMKTILDAAPSISFDTVLRWATLNGALALGMEKDLGTIEKGKKPGLVNIPAFEWHNSRLSPESLPNRLI